MKKAGRVLALASVVFVSFLSHDVSAEVLTEDQKKDAQIKSIVQTVFHEHGFSVDPAGVILIHEGKKIVVALDVTETIAGDIADQIMNRLKESDLSFRDSLLEVNLFGAAEASLGSDSAQTIPAKRWNDVLSAAGRGRVVKAGVATEPWELSLGVQPMIETTSLPGFSDELFERARKIILSHLVQIKESGEMYSTILMESYWKGVFSEANSPDLYDIGKPLVSQALVAGIRPYREGKPLNATVFADLAMKAVRMHAGLLPTPPLIIRP